MRTINIELYSYDELSISILNKSIKKLSIISLIKLQMVRVYKIRGSENHVSETFLIKLSRFNGRAIVSKISRD